MTTAAVQAAWAELAMASLVAAGVGELVISPGSRSTPLALAAVRVAGLRRTVIVDERSAGFFALGAARATGRAVALLCTSGTAAAHYLPAVIEASLAGVALIVVSADRPPELHGAGASQTIDQQRLFGGFVRRFDDVGPPDGSALALRALRRKIVQAVAAARGPGPGPVHLNLPLRKPLEPAAATTAAEHAAVAEVARLIASPAPIVTPSSVRVPGAAIAAAAAVIAGSARGVIVAAAAPAAHRALRAPTWRLAEKTGYPVLAEAGSQLRFAARPDGVAAIDHFPLVVAVRADLAPDVVVQLGGEPVALAWPGLLAARPPRRIVLAEHGWPDGDSSAELVLIGDVADTLTRLAAAVAERRTAWTATWRAAEADAAAAMRAARAAAAPWSETDLIARVIADLPDGAIVVVGNSLPIRVIDEAATTARALTVLTQRGAAGIDGLIAGAAGAAWATATPTTVILGDVSFGHDVGSLAVTAGLPLTIVVVDNRGGHIFDELPLAAAGVEPSIYRELWLTPSALDPVALATGFGVAARTVREPDALSGIRTAGPHLVHAVVAADGARLTRTRALTALRAVCSPIAQGAAS